MHRRIPQGAKVASSIMVLFLFLIALVAFDPWIFREPELLSPHSRGKLVDERERTALAYENYSQWRLSHLEQVYTWQARSTKIIFWLSMLISVSGVGFSFWQFLASAKEAEKASQENEIEIKSQLISLSLKSRSIAALVLFVSMAYLALYTLLIYPIRLTSAAVPGPQSQSTLSDGKSAQPKDAGIPKSLIDQADNRPLEETK
jgi:Trk-type K+ transport system membrane component